MSAEETQVLVVGAGAAGLAAARDLAASGMQPLVVDASDRPGGVMRSERRNGYLVDAGPNSFLVKAPMDAFIARHGLDAALVSASAESRHRSLFDGDRLVSLPHGPGSAVGTPLLSLRGKLRLLAEPFISQGDPTGESVHEFVSRRLGEEVATRLVGAFLTGVYAGDERELGIEAVFPALVGYERDHGSLLRGGIAGLKARRAASESAGGRSGSWSSPKGLGDLAAQIAAGLPQPVELQTRVVRLTAEADGWHAELEGPNGARRVVAERVVLATASRPAADLLERVDPEAGEILRSIDYAPIAAISIGVDPSEVREPIEGFGFIVPRAAGMKLLGCLFMNRVFGGRAPASRELLHLMVGGVRWPEAVDQSDDQLLAPVLQDLDRCIGLKAPPEVVAIRRWERAIPQPGRNHTRMIEALEQRVSAQRRLAIAGSYLYGVSVPDTLASGIRAAEQTLAAD